MNTPLEIRLYAALKQITKYMPPQKLEKQAEKLYGLPASEALEMAYRERAARGEGRHQRRAHQGCTLIPTLCPRT